MRFQCCALGVRQDEPVLHAGLLLFEQNTGRKVEWEWFERREDLLYRLRHGSCDASVIALPGALGMESAMGVREMLPRVPMIWISEDGNFAVQAYRLRVQMFLQTPVTEQQVAAALERCVEKEYVAR